MRFLAFVVFAFSTGSLVYIIRKWNAEGGRVELNPAKWSNLNKFFTLPVSLFCVLVLAGTFVMVTHSNNEIDKMWADAGMTAPTAEQVAAREAKRERGSTFEYRKCNRKPDPFGNFCKDPYQLRY